MDASSLTFFDADAPRSIVTYNLKNANDIFHWIRRAPVLTCTIHRLAPTLMGTQEGNISQLEYIRDNVAHLDFVGTGRMADGTDETNGIFYDTRVVSPAESGNFWLSETPDEPGSMMPGESLPRMATWLRCHIKGLDHPLLMVNTHLTHTGISTDAQTQALIDGITRIADPDDDIALTGDFNQQRQSAGWHAIVRAGFIDALDLATGHQGPQFTFPDWVAVPEEDETKRPLTDRIDWIFYRPGEGRPLPSGLTVRTVNTHTTAEMPSDHFPVVLANQPG